MTENDAPRSRPGFTRDAAEDTLGPESLTWRRFGDLRTALLIVWAGVLQAMHPVISSALVEHSDFLDNPMNRLLRSAGPITRAVYEGPSVGRAIRDEHTNIRGRYSETGAPTEDGAEYHSLNPEPFFWAHSTFFMMQIRAAGVFTRELSADEKEQLYRESLTWYRQYGVSMSHPPEDFDAFLEYWNHTVDTVLTRTEIIDRAHWFFAGAPGPSPFPQIPRWAWRVAGPVTTRFLIWVGCGLLPENARESLGWRWSGSDQRRFDLFARGVRTVFAVLPPRLRMVSIARRGYSEATRAT